MAKKGPSRVSSLSHLLCSFCVLKFFSFFFCVIQYIKHSIFLGFFDSFSQSDPSDPQVSNETTFLQTYNCDQEKAPRMNTLPAEKQIYLADYVLLHFVHYSTVTALSILSQNETESRGLLWKERYHETSVDFPDELTEATMIHTKTVTAQDVRLWKSFCKAQTYFPIFNQMKKLDVRSGPNPCKIGIPFPVGKDHGNGLLIIYLFIYLLYTYVCSELFIELFISV